MQEEKIIGLIQENPSIMVRPILTDGQHLITGFKETVYQTFLEQITFKG
ncbi:arsenate reductase family protein [Thermanaerosceptrum fracticalcis]